uniref:Uncharacterized protein n=1 Tax=viral metagenome TaxID=1070528 RepID=A0A6M3K7N6_9ZZZZ
MAVKYVCIQKYFSGTKLYRPGDFAVFKNAKDGPQKDGKLICFEPVIVGEETPVKPPGPRVKVNTKDV